MAILKICDICKSKDKKAHSSIDLLSKFHDIEENVINLIRDYCIDCLVKAITSNYGGEMAPRAKDTCYEDCCYKKDTA